MRQIILAAFFGVGLLPAAMTQDQKVADLQQIAGLFAQHYGPYEWKRDTQGHDLFDLAPWLERARRTANDIEFMELLVDWVAALNDAHVALSYPSNFLARLGFTADIFEGKILIDFITRGTLPAARYPFEVGDEVVSLDGVPMVELIPRFRKYAISANPRSTDRQAVSRIFTRAQSRMPSAHLTDDKAQLVIRRASGAEESYELPWVKSGDPFTQAAPNLQPLAKACTPAARRSAPGTPEPTADISAC